MSIENQIPEAIRAAFRSEAHAVAYELKLALTAVLSPAYVLQSQDHDFAVDRFAAGGGCRRTPLLGANAELYHGWNEHVYRNESVQACTIEWEHKGQTVEMTEVVVSWGNSSCKEEVRTVAAPSEAVALAFFQEVCRWSTDLDGAILLFDRGYWAKNEALYEQIRATRLEDLILPEGQREEVLDDLQRFLDRRTEYDRLNVPWKRGVLLTGPPGNGKTMCIKVLANNLTVTTGDGERSPIRTLYVRSLAHPHYPDHYMIGEVFKRARRCQPCMLVFEDLDSLLNDENRSVFLNELDGLAVNSGILTIASTNHPERLDPALRNRPSRFDRKWHFKLPAKSERRRFLKNWCQRDETPIDLDGPERRRIAAATDGFSFAYLKELLISSLMRWIDEGEDQATLVEVIGRQVDTLRDQMRESEVPPGTVVDDEDDSQV